jgi:antitoxin (DNA-binding transcriptional repressor) of toxin-antitoxin stability system
MTTMTAFETKLHFGDVLGRVQRGEEILITRYDKAIARIVPERQRDSHKIAAAVDGLLALQQRIATRTGKRATLTDSEVRMAIEEGRE